MTPGSNDGRSPAVCLCLHCGSELDCRYASLVSGRPAPAPNLSLQETVWEAIWPEGSHLTDIAIRLTLSSPTVFSVLESLMARGLVVRIRHGVYQRLPVPYVAPKRGRRPTSLTRSARRPSQGEQV